MQSFPCMRMSRAHRVEFSRVRPSCRVLRSPGALLRQPLESDALHSLRLASRNYAGPMLGSDTFTPPHLPCRFVSAADRAREIAYGLPVGNQFGNTVWRAHDAISYTTYDADASKNRTPWTMILIQDVRMEEPRHRLQRARADAGYDNPSDAARALLASSFVLKATRHTTNVGDDPLLNLNPGSPDSSMKTSIQNYRRTFPAGQCLDSPNSISPVHGP